MREYLHDWNIISHGEEEIRSLVAGLSGAHVSLTGDGTGIQTQLAIEKPY